jgi:hypothetical protein
MEGFVEQHSGELMILILGALILLTLLILVPQLLRAHHQTQLLRHEERMKALEQGQDPPQNDERSRFAGRMVVLVPMVAVCAAGIVTCFLAGYRAESLFSVGLTTWTVAGVVSLAAITGGVALLGRLAQQDEEIEAGDTEEYSENILEHRRRGGE